MIDRFVIWIFRHWIMGRAMNWSIALREEPDGGIYLTANVDNRPLFSIASDFYDAETLAAKVREYNVEPEDRR